VISRSGVGIYTNCYTLTFTFTFTFIVFGEVCVSVRQKSKTADLKLTYLGDNMPHGKRYKWLEVDNI